MVRVLYLADTIPQCGPLARHRRLPVYLKIPRADRILMIHGRESSNGVHVAKQRSQAQKIGDRAGRFKCVTRTSRRQPSHVPCCFLLNKRIVKHKTELDGQPVGRESCHERPFCKQRFVPSEHQQPFHCVCAKKSTRQLLFTVAVVKFSKTHRVFVLPRCEPKSRSAQSGHRINRVATGWRHSPDRLSVHVPRQPHLTYPPQTCLTYSRTLCSQERSKTLSPAPTKAPAKEGKSGKKTKKAKSSNKKALNVHVESVTPVLCDASSARGSEAKSSGDE